MCVVVDHVCVCMCGYTTKYRTPMQLWRPYFIMSIML